jgi:hypothetical protein
LYTTAVKVVRNGRLGKREHDYSTGGRRKSRLASNAGMAPGPKRAIETESKWNFEKGDLGGVAESCFADSDLVGGGDEVVIFIESSKCNKSNGPSAIDSK